MWHNEVEVQPKRAIGQKIDKGMPNSLFIAGYRAVSFMHTEPTFLNDFPIHTEIKDDPKKDEPKPDSQPRTVTLIPAGEIMGGSAPVIGVVAMMAVALPLVFALRSDPQAAQNASHGKMSAPNAGIIWQANFECARHIAASSGKTLMIFFGSEWNEKCRQVEREVFARAPIIAEMQRFVALKVDGESQPQLAARYGVESYPAIVWTDAAGEEKERIDGPFSGYELFQLLQQLR